MAMNPYQKYQQQSIMTMTRGELLTKLYDETIKELNRAELMLQEKELDKVNASLQKAQKILLHLKATLDPQYEISKSLDALYEFFIYRITQANIHKESESISQILPMIVDLRDTFIQADKLASSGAH